MRQPDVRNICFHGIGTPGRAIDDTDESHYWIERDTYLRVLDEIATWPATTVSFDDGNVSDIEIGLPALVERGLTATFFVLAGRLDTPGSLTTDDVAALHGAGMRVGSHGMDHVSWRSMAPAVRRRELVDAREVIAGVVGEVTEAALPRGQYDRTTLTWLRRLGYQAVHTSDRRPATPGAWLQPRFSVTCHDTPATLVQAALTPRPTFERATLELKGLVKRLR
ncbi:polysaccharide deacetylase family protein [Cellulomonas sp. P22]|uniref:polysaccharide deacetylase family protein n=1 Tax=Cellulomonas sp. P22 TaxID=3373189 RepID=UPI0037B0DF75